MPTPISEIDYSALTRIDDRYSTKRPYPLLAHLLEETGLSARKIHDLLHEYVEEMRGYGSPVVISEDAQGMSIDPEYVEAVENEIVHDDTPVTVYKIVGYLGLYIIPSREPGKWESWDLNLGGGCDDDPQVLDTYDEALDELFESVSILTGEGRGSVPEEDALTEGRGMTRKDLLKIL